MRVGLLSLGDHLADPATGMRVSQQTRFASIVEQGVGAEERGFDGAFVGEHHFCDYIVSSPQMMLAAIASRTSTIRLGTGTSLVANHDPVHTAEDFATLDVLSGGRLELVAGRGILPWTYAQFGQQIAESRATYGEHLELIVRLWTENDVHWTGHFRPPLQGVTLAPKPVQQPHPPVWIGGGTSFDSVDLAARLGFDLMLPSVLSHPKAFVKMIARYREQRAVHGFDPDTGRIGAVSHTHVAKSSQEAHQRWEPWYRNYIEWVHSLFADSPDYASRVDTTFNYQTLTTGPAVCGSPAEVIDRATSIAELLGLDTYLFMFDHGGIPDGPLWESIDLFAGDVIPVIRAL